MLNPVRRVQSTYGVDRDTAASIVAAHSPSGRAIVLTALAIGAAIGCVLFVGFRFKLLRPGSLTTAGVVFLAMAANVAVTYARILSEVRRASAEGRCIRCSYALVGLPTHPGSRRTCPECGLHEPDPKPRSASG